MHLDMRETSALEEVHNKIANSLSCVDNELACIDCDIANCLSGVLKTLCNRYAFLCQVLTKNGAGYSYPSHAANNSNFSSCAPATTTAT
jgi:hypothetical protein